VEKLSLWDEANTKRHEETMIESWDAHFLTDKSASVRILVHTIIVWLLQP